MKFRFALISSFLIFFSTLLTAQQPKPATQPQQPPPPLITPEVHSDDSVTFRFRAPNAQEVKVTREGAEALLMQKDDSGVWAVNTPALPPDYYGYSFVVDGVRTIDRSDFVFPARRNGEDEWMEQT